MIDVMLKGSGVGYTNPCYEIELNDAQRVICDLTQKLTRKW